VALRAAKGDHYDHDRLLIYCRPAQRDSEHGYGAALLDSSFSIQSEVCRSRRSWIIGAASSRRSP